VAVPDLWTLGGMDVLTFILDAIGTLLMVAVIAAVGYNIWYKRDIRRQAKRGYVIERAGAPEGLLIIYTENGGRIYLDGDPRTYTIRVPSHTEWMEKMPPWARERRDEIVRRIREHYRKGPCKLEDDTA
jgi:hypothetical protein